MVSAEKVDIATCRSELEQIYRDARPSMRALNAMMDFRWRRSVAERNPVRHWYKGRVVPLGDAAHAPLQSAEGIARDVRNATVADWAEEHMFDCLSWLYDGAPMLTKLDQ